MGFITSGSCDGIMEVCFTPLGREYIAQGLGSKLITKYFTLGDSDSNYLIQRRLCFIPDITGVSEAERGFIDTEFTDGTHELIANSSCIIPTIQNDIKYKLSLSGDTSIIPRELVSGQDYCC